MDRAFCLAVLPGAALGQDCAPRKQAAKASLELRAGDVSYRHDLDTDSSDVNGMLFLRVEFPNGPAATFSQEHDAQVNKTTLRGLLEFVDASAEQQLTQVGSKVGDDALAADFDYANRVRDTIPVRVR